MKSHSAQTPPRRVSVTRFSSPAVNPRSARRQRAALEEQAQRERWFAVVFDHENLRAVLKHTVL